MPDPMLGYTRWIEPVETRVGPQENIFTLSQRFPFPGKLSLKAEIADQQSELSRLQWQTARRNLIAGIKNNVLEYYRVEKSIIILQTFRQHLQNFLQSANAAYISGREAQVQVIKLQVEIGNLEGRILEFQNKKNRVLSEIRSQIDWPAEKSLLINTDNLVFPDTFNRDSLLSTVKIYNQELSSIKAKQLKSDKSLSLAKRDYWPDFTIQGTYITIPKKGSMFSDAGKDAYGIMFGLNLPLWFSGRNAARDQAVFESAAQENMYDDQQQKLINEVEDLLFQVKNEKNNLDLYEKSLVPQARDALESALTAYETGRINLTDMLQLHYLLHNVEIQSVNSRVRLGQLAVKIEQITGGDRRFMNFERN